MNKKRSYIFLIIILLASMIALEPARAGLGDEIGNTYRGAIFMLKKFGSNRQFANQDESAVIAKMIDRLGEYPTRNIDIDPASQKLIREDGVYVSLTTSPARIGKINMALQTIDMSHVDGIFLNLPMKFGRDGSTYEIPPEIAQNPKITIIRTEIDVGPATKIVPAIEHLKEIGRENALVISIDDDIGYPIGMINEYIFIASRIPNAVFSAAAQNYEFWRMDGTAVRPTPGKLRLSGEGFVAVQKDVIEGFGAVAYRPRLVNTQAIRALANTSRAAYASDDLTISLSLEAEGVPRFRVTSRSVGLDKLSDFPYGQGSDALHRGAGIGITGVDVNAKKYRDTFLGYVASKNLQIRCEMLFTNSR